MASILQVLHDNFVVSAIDVEQEDGSVTKVIEMVFMDGSIQYAFNPTSDDLIQILKAAADTLPKDCPDASRFYKAYEEYSREVANSQVDDIFKKKD